MSHDDPVILLYVPVLHQGYVEFFKRHRTEATEVWLPSPKLVEELMPLHQEIRALDPYLMVTVLRGASLVSGAWIVTDQVLEELSGRRIITANEDISRKMVELIPNPGPVEYDTVFLRWDESSVAKTEPAGYDRISEDPFDRRMMDVAEQQAEKSSDWWRHVGAVLVKDGTIVTQVENRHVPSQQTQYVNGDPRDFIEAGTRSEVNTTLHGEQAVITWAARSGVALEGTSLYVTVFPCPMCAKQVAYSGIKKVYFASGHASLDGASILHQNGVELVLVK